LTFIGLNFIGIEDRRQTSDPSGWATIDQLYRETFDAGSIIFREGETGDRAFVIESGLVQISSLRKGIEVALASFGEGELFGEMALIDEQVRSATARAMDETTVVVISRRQVGSKIEDADPLLSLFLNVILQRLRATTDVVRRLQKDTVKTVPSLPNPVLKQLRERAMSSLRLEQDLQIAVEEQQFELYYQPIMRLSDLQPAGFEALIRWQHPEHGMISPLKFIGLAEKTGLIVQLGEWILQEACRALPHLRKKVGLPELFMSVNLSVRQIAAGSLVESILRILDESEVDSEAIKLEVTESVLMQDPETATRVLGQLKQLGFELAIDDFGTGYSSLSYLHRFPIDVLKVDRSFVSLMLEDSASLKIVRTVTRLAQDLDMQVVAEGIERREELEVIRDLGCEFGQGYYFSRPYPLAMIMEKWGSTYVK
jgi:EAL domain-containing protein (putative c-di-GMP-specific phosphodiesterase class I)